MSEDTISLSVPLVEGERDRALLLTGSPADVAEAARRLQAEGRVPPGALNAAVRDNGIVGFGARYRADLASRAVDVANDLYNEDGMTFHETRGEADKHASACNRESAESGLATASFPFLAEISLPSGRTDRVTLFATYEAEAHLVEDLLVLLSGQGRLGVVGEAGKVSEIPIPVVLRVSGLAPRWRERVAESRAGI